MRRKEQRHDAANEYCQSEAVPAANMQMAYGDFINGAKWADRTMIDKACEWMELRLVGTMGSEDAYEFLTKFRKAMEE